MDRSRKKELLEQYANRVPQMGVVCFKCLETGERFLRATHDSRAEYNSVRMKLNTRFHPNKHLLALWQLHGESGFEQSMAAILKYENPHKDYTEELEALVQKCLAEDENASRMWR